MYGNAYTIDAEVLIYPYWNVNWLSVLLCRVSTAGFNLSILECKVAGCLLRVAVSLVLIYPYWNVKNKTALNLLAKDRF